MPLMKIYSTRKLATLQKLFFEALSIIQKMRKQTNKCPSLLCNLVIKNEGTNNKERFLTSVMRWKSSMQNNKYNMTFLVEKEGGYENIFEFAYFYIKNSGKYLRT